MINYLDEISPGLIGFSGTYKKNILQAAIRFFTDSKFSHERI